jgi:6-phosphogluconate dehydrogenase
MQLGMIGLGRMGGNMARRLMRAGHECVAFDLDAGHVASLAKDGATGTASIDAFVQALTPPRAAWVMVPAGEPTEHTVNSLAALMQPGDIVIDGGNSHFKDDVRRASALAVRGIHYVDVGTSGGVWGLERGYCLMIGGSDAAVGRLDPVFQTLAPGTSGLAPSPGREGRGGRAERGYLHCGPPGSGHFVKMIHNGIEYGLMQAYAEGFEILHASDYPLDLAAISDLWNHGSVVRSWLLELATDAFHKGGQDLSELKGWVADSGEGRWTVQEAIDRDVPAPIITLSLQTRFRSRQDDSYGAKVLAALRNEFGGHAVKNS